MSKEIVDSEFSPRRSRGKKSERLADHIYIAYISPTGLESETGAPVSGRALLSVCTAPKRVAVPLRVRRSRAAVDYLVLFTLLS